MSKAREIADISQDVTQLDNTKQDSAFLIGQVCYFAMSSAPTGFIKANGAELSRTVYADLFSVIGTTFGLGDGSTTFNLPDLRGEFIRGFDDGRGVDTGRVIGDSQADEFKSHKHGTDVQNIDNGVAGGSGRGGTSVGSSGAYTTLEGGAETRPRNVNMLACIKY